METEHGPGLFLFISTLTGTGTLSTVSTVYFVLLHAITVLFLRASSLLSGLVHTILSILQARPLSGCCNCTRSPDSCCHYGCRDEDECDNRTDQDSFIHGFSSIWLPAGRLLLIRHLPVLHQTLPPGNKPFLRAAATYRVIGAESLKARLYAAFLSII